MSPGLIIALIIVVFISVAAIIWGIFAITVSTKKDPTQLVKVDKKAVTYQCPPDKWPDYTEPVGNGYCRKPIPDGYEINKTTGQYLSKCPDGMKQNALYPKYCISANPEKIYSSKKKCEQDHGSCTGPLGFYHKVCPAGTNWSHQACLPTGCSGAKGCPRQSAGDVGGTKLGTKRCPPAGFPTLTLKQGGYCLEPCPAGYAQRSGRCVKQNIDTSVADTSNLPSANSPLAA